jgi:lipid A 3-O-deacylase
LTLATVVVLATGLIVALLCSPGVAAELVAPVPSATLFDPYRFEIHFGGFAHGVGSVEKGTIDLNGELVFPRFPIGQTEWWNFLVPRFHIGGNVNLSGRTSSIYAGGAVDRSALAQVFRRRLLGWRRS